MLPTVTPEQIVSAVAQFSAKTTTVDGLHPRQLGWIPSKLLSLLADIAAVSEAHLAWPLQECQVVTVLLGKPDGGLRPIALYCTVARVLGKVRVPSLRAWAQKCRGEVFSNAGGRRIGDSTRRVQTRTHVANAAYSAEFVADLREAFEHARRDVLLRLATPEQHPAHVLAVSVAQCCFHRLVTRRTRCSAEVTSTRGIAAGSPTATRALWLYLCPALTKLREARKPTTLQCPARV